MVVGGEVRFGGGSAAAGELAGSIAATRTPFFIGSRYAKTPKRCP